LLIHGKDENAEPGCIQLQGELDGKSAAPLSNVAIRVQWIKGTMEEFYDLVADVASELAWIVAAFKKPPEEGLSFSRSEIKETFPTGRNDKESCSNFRIVHDDIQGLEEEDGTCWHKLFTRLNVAVGFRIPPRPDAMRGVELPLSLMTAFAGIGYPVAYKGGFVLKGRKNALFPYQTHPGFGTIGEASAIQ
jgi:hypothetical protein